MKEKNNCDLSWQQLCFPSLVPGEYSIFLPWFLTKGIVNFFHFLFNRSWENSCTQQDRAEHLGVCNTDFPAGPHLLLLFRSLKNALLYPIFFIFFLNASILFALEWKDYAIIMVESLISHLSWGMYSSKLSSCQCSHGNYICIFDLQCLANVPFRVSVV